MNKLRFTLLIIIFILFQIGCKYSNENKKENVEQKGTVVVMEGEDELLTDKSGLTDTGWMLLEMEGWESEIMVQIWIDFNQNEERRFRGFASCNRFFGSYQQSEDSLTLSHIASTKKFCPQMKIEDYFLLSLEKISRYEINNSRLYLYQDRDPLMVFKMFEIKD